MRLHPCSFVCQHCSRPAQILEVCFTAEGQIQIDGICIKCNASVTLTSTIGEVCANCHFSDVQDTGLFVPQASQLVN